MNNDLNYMCDLVNKKYGLQPNQIGSIEYHSDMAENSIVQIMNEQRGTRQLMWGDSNVLALFLQKLLNN